MPISADGAGEIFRHMEWADARMWTAVAASDAARADETIRMYLLHIHAVQQAFLALWMNEPVDPILDKHQQNAGELIAIREWARPYYPRVHQFIDAADAATYARRLVTPWVAQYEQHLGMTFAVPTVSETMFQVVNHTTHHRGQVLARLRSLGAEPPLVDFIAWVWFGKPAAPWDVPAAEGVRT